MMGDTTDDGKPTSEVFKVTFWRKLCNPCTAVISLAIFKKMKYNQTLITQTDTGRNDTDERQTNRL